MMSLWAARLKPLVRHVRDIPMSTGPCRFCPSTALRGFATIEHRVGWVRDLAADAELTDQQMTTKSSKSSRPTGRPRGRPFQKGVSGNPSGRPAKPIERRAIEIDVRRYAKGFGREMVNKLVELARGKLNIGEDKQGNAKYMPVSPATQLTAAEALLDRGYGRPAQAIELAGKDGGPIVHESESAYDIICRRIEAIRQRIIDDGHLIEP